MAKNSKSKKTMADPSRLEPSGKQMLRVVIEKPKGSRNKFAFDPDEHIFELKKVLPGTILRVDQMYALRAVLHICTKNGR